MRKKYLLAQIWLYKIQGLKKKPDPMLKFMFFKKATIFDKIFTIDLTLCIKCQIDGDDFINFCGLLGKYELYPLLIQKS